MSSITLSEQPQDIETANFSPKINSKHKPTKTHSESDDVIKVKKESDRKKKRKRDKESAIPKIQVNSIKQVVEPFDYESVPNILDASAAASAPRPKKTRKEAEKESSKNFSKTNFGAPPRQINERGARSMVFKN